MGFCDHCQGQRFDRAQVLRELRATRKRLRIAGDREAERCLGRAIEAVRALEIPHLEVEDHVPDADVVH
jgi:hypothetical protein